jgi:S-DNA-T family DNA segregation ATPase FtsK/SpoIIIE
VFVVDEFAQVQLWPVRTRDEKESKAQVIADLTRISMLGRAAGIIIVAAIQKPTTDVMDSSFRGNLQGKVVFRLDSRLMASSMVAELDALEWNPVRLQKGRCIFYNANNGETYYLQAQVAPGLEL